MTFGNKLLLIITVSQVQRSTLFASQALCKSSEETSEAQNETFHKPSSITIGNTRPDIEETFDEPLEQEFRNKVCEEDLSKNEAERLAHDSSQNCQSEQELKNKVSEEVLLKTTTAATVHSSQNKSTIASQSITQENKQHISEQQLSFSHADVCHYLDERAFTYDPHLEERAFTYDPRYNITVNNGKAVCPLASCAMVALQKDEKGRCCFRSNTVTPVQVMNPKITHVTCIPATRRCQCILPEGSKPHTCCRRILVYLGCNLQLLGTYDEHGKPYNASILLVQDNLTPNDFCIIVQRFPSPQNACLLEQNGSSTKNACGTQPAL